MILVLLSPLSLVAQTTFRGSVVDSSGAAISGAEVKLSAPDFNRTTQTADNGSFALTGIAVKQAALIVSKPGFATLAKPWTAADNPVRVVLSPASRQEQVTVSATRTPAIVAETANSVQVVSRTDLASSGALTLDDTLRQVPGFTLFRRTGSLAANPTTQGVSLRGTGGSGAGRALVLYHGVPLNDPFGGWIYWDRVPLISIEEVEVLRGGGSDLYGTGALSGVVTVQPRRPAQSEFAGEAYFGNSSTPSTSAYWNWRLGNTSLRATGEAFSSDGYFQVRDQDRGAVDTKAGQKHYTGRLGLAHDFNRSQVFVDAGLFKEERDNGTRLQDNHTRIGQIILGTDWMLGKGSLNLRAYGEGEHYFQTFTAVSDDRDSEDLIRTQRVPAQRLGVSGFYTRAAGPHTWVAGFELQDLRGHSDELVFSSGTPILNPDNGGRQRSAGFFAEDVIRLGQSWVATAGMRVDRWRNFDAFSDSVSLLKGTVSTSQLPERSETAVSPRLSLLRHLTGNWSVAAAVYRSFRAPTLNELYRPFRVGDILTTANDALRAERLSGGEASLIGRASGRASFRGTFFWEDVSRPVANVTLSVTPQLITRQRQNLGRTRSRGLELQADARLAGNFTLAGGYQFADTAVLEFPADTSLLGLEVPQVPRHQFTLQARYQDPSFATLALQGRYVGRQFDDDRNQFALDPYFTVDAFASHRMSRTVEIFAAAENLFNQRYMVGRTPMIAVGPPLLARIGLRFEFSRK